MAIARVATFDGVTTERIEELKARVQTGERPEGLNATETIFLHDADTGGAVAILFFESEEEYERGNEVLEAMSPADTPGERTTVKKYEVAMRM